MIDFTDCKRIDGLINGGESKKEWIIYKGKYYLLKPPSMYKKNKDSTYYNQCFSEYISCHIFNLLGVKVQNTILGINKYNGIENVVVACEDITNNNYYDLVQFSDLIDSKVNNNIFDIIKIINTQDKIDKKLLLEYFWEVFVVDALVNNIDRDIKNLGVLFDRNEKKYYISPVYDLGRSLYDYIKFDTIKKIIDGDDKLLKDKIINDSFSVLYDEHGKHINFIEFFKKCNNVDFISAVERIRVRIDMDKIYEIIDETPLLNKEINLFYKLVLSMRYDILFDRI